MATTKEGFLGAVPDQFSDVFDNYFEEWKESGFIVEFGSKGFGMKVHWKGKWKTVFKAYPDKLTIYKKKNLSKDGFTEGEFRDYHSILTKDSPKITTMFLKERHEIKYHELTDDEVKKVLKCTTSLARSWAKIETSKFDDLESRGKKDSEVPKVFVSYSWDDEEHKAWVAGLATELRANGIEAILDQWDVVPGDHLTSFMETSIRESDYVLVICTPKYRQKSDARIGGVGYEGDVVTAELFSSQNHRKFIPILARGSWEESASSWIRGKAYIDMSSSDTRSKNRRILFDTLNGVASFAPPVNSTHSSDARIQASFRKESTTILKESSLSKDGTIMVRNFIGGGNISTNGKILATAKKRREYSKWEDGISELLKNGLIRDPTGKGVLYYLTAEGYEAADLLDEETDTSRKSHTVMEINQKNSFGDNIVNVNNEPDDRILDEPAKAMIRDVLNEHPTSVFRIVQVNDREAMNYGNQVREFVSSLGVPIDGKTALGRMVLPNGSTEGQLILRNQKNPNEVEFHIGFLKRL
jgi:hypothetical protein